MNFLVRALLIAVVEGVDDTFTNGHTDAVAIVFAETRGFRYAQTHFLSEIDAFDLRLQRDFEVFLVCRHGPLTNSEEKRPESRSYP
jgi:hypothetical protein